MKKFLFVCMILLASGAQAGDTIDRILKNNAINCGYVTFVPNLVKDSATSKYSGFDYELMNAVANLLDTKANFKTEGGWGTIPEDLRAKKYDMLCVLNWQNPKIAKFVLYSRPVYYQPVFLVARANDTRFDTDKAVINDAKVKVVVVDGDSPMMIAKNDFPKAKITELPPTTDFSQVFVNVADGKGDVTISDKYSFEDYNEHNPGKLKIVQPQNPIRIYPGSYAFAPDDYVLQGAVNSALDALILDGTVHRLIKKYEKYPGVYYDAEVPMKK